MRPAMSSRAMIVESEACVPKRIEVVRRAGVASCEINHDVSIDEVPITGDLNNAVGREDD